VTGYKSPIGDGKRCVTGIKLECCQKVYED
jgi:hypothetical protein